MTTSLYKKESGNLLWYFTAKGENEEAAPLSMLQKWGLPIPPTLKITIGRKTDEATLKQLLTELESILYPWVEKYGTKTHTFSLSTKKNNEPEALVLNKIGLCPTRVASTDNLLTQQIYWLNLFTLLTAYGTCCLQIAQEEFEKVKTDQKKYEGAYLDFDLSNSALEELVKEAQNKVEKKQNTPLSYQTVPFLQNALTHLISTYCNLLQKPLFAKEHKASDTITFTVQAHLLSACPAENADLILYSEDPISHKKEWTGEFLQGYEQFLSSIYSIHPLSQTARLRYGYMEESFEELDPSAYLTLLKTLEKVSSSKEGYWKLCAQYSEGLIVFSDSKFVPSFDFEQYCFSQIPLQRAKKAIRIPALSVSSGYIQGKIALSLDYAKKCYEQKIPCILAIAPSKDDLSFIPYCSGLLLMGGGITSALAEKAREAKVPALLKSKALLFNPGKKELYLGEYRLQEGDEICIDSFSHAILLPFERYQKKKNVVEISFEF